VSNRFSFRNRPIRGTGAWPGRGNGRGRIRPKLSNEDASGSDPVVNSGTGSDRRMVPPFAHASDEATASIRAVAMIAKRSLQGAARTDADIDVSSPTGSRDGRTSRKRSW
jgi:hypothetical protein